MLLRATFNSSSHCSSFLSFSTVIPLSINALENDVAQSTRLFLHVQWLLTDALPNNPKLTEAEPGSWVFNPALPIRDRKGLLKLLRSNDLRGGGGILVEDIQESVPQYVKVLKVCAETN